MAEQEPTSDGLESIGRLREENAALRAAVRARDDFISLAAHELRNPMTPLLGQISLLRTAAHLADGAVPERIVRGIERLELIVRRYIRRTATLLDVSRLTSGTFHLDLTQTDASSVVSDIAADFAFHAEAAGSALTMSIETGIVALLDRTAIEEVAENLISNAIKYGDGKPIEVTLTRGAGQICLQVRDHGLGISAADQARIFEQFERVIDSHPTSGFGLGLWVVGRLTEAMSGTVTVDSLPGEGSTFVVRLPLETMKGNE
jgi:signal transduction histidine kinase